MRILALAVALAVGLLAPLPASRAAPDTETAVLTPDSQELVVFEIKQCPYCELFRRDILPTYQRSRHAADLPIRFVDVAAVDTDRLPLLAPVTTVPTIVLMRDGREAGRISGYTGPEIFFQMIDHMRGPGR